MAILNAISMEDEHIDFVVSILTSEKNKAALHPANRNLTEWHEVFTKNLTDPDEANFIICKDSYPVAWLKINGLQTGELQTSESQTAGIQANELQSDGDNACPNPDLIRQSDIIKAWIAMLVVGEYCQRQGIGSYAVRYAEDFVRSKGFKILGIHTTIENVAAQRCYKKLGYRIHEEGECTTGDGVTRYGLSLHRVLEY